MDMTRRSFVPRLLALQLAAIFLLLSCATSRPPQRLKVHVPPGFAGTIQLSPCVSSAPAAEISTDAQGRADTSVCPHADGNLEIVLIQGNREYTAARDDISIPRTGDGIATSINVRVRP
jgi:hypothetical protein